MTVYEFEQAVLALEDIRIVLKASWRTPVEDYPYQRAASGTSSVTEWLQARIYPLVAGIEVAVIDGNGAVPHGRTRLATVRNTFDR